MYNVVIFIEHKNLLKTKFQTVQLTDFNLNR